MEKKYAKNFIAQPMDMEEGGQIKEFSIIKIKISQFMIKDKV